VTSENFRPNNPNVIHEVIDGEAVLVSMETGSYYSIDNVGADIWGYIESGLSIPQIVEAIAEHYTGSHEEIAEGVNQLVDQLQQERLIVPDESRRDHISGPGTNGCGQSKVQFEKPVLHKYTDMEDLLLLDPIHEVDDTGWPTKAANK
jgi:hypothetical protein